LYDTFINPQFELYIRQHHKYTENSTQKQTAAVIVRSWNQYNI